MKVAIAPIVLSTASLGLMLGVAQNAQAALIPNVTASSNMGNSLLLPNIVNTVNGNGLPGNNPSLTGNHAFSLGGNAWASAIGNRTGNITFDLGHLYSLEGFSFWNLSGLLFRNRGINGVTVQSSTDGTNWTNIAGAPTSFNIGNILFPQPPEVFSFSPVTASSVRFLVNSNHGSVFNSTGFSEVQFNGTKIPIPEPSSLLALLAFGLAGVGLRKRI